MVLDQRLCVVPIQGSCDKGLVTKQSLPTSGLRLPSNTCRHVSVAVPAKSVRTLTRRCVLTDFIVQMIFLSSLFLCGVLIGEKLSKGKTHE
jgi:hypothetical protein